MPKSKLSNDQRRALTLALLSGESPTALSRRYGVARSRVYALGEEAKRDAHDKVLESEKEYFFRIDVSRLTKGDG